MKEILSKKKVFVGMSGGVDSSVSAALLKKAGYDVTGVFIKVWQPEGMVCTWKEDRLDAMRAAAVLDIPFLTFDFEKEYKKEVVDYMIREYKEGRTPNPDVMCNKEIKFGSFLKKALSMGADYAATGHYAQNIKNELTISKDLNKDQTYFLWTLTDEQLKHVLFPIGHLTKPEVRNLAKKFKLPTFDKKDSQGLCFIGKVDMKDFLKGFIREKKGKVLNEKGGTIGEHDGVAFYTLGERHGFTITEKTDHEKPYYIIHKDVKKNTLTVSDKKEDLSEEEKVITLTNIRWPDDKETKENYFARIRYRQELQKCKVEKIKDTLKVGFENPIHFASEGQSCVIYDGNRCVGGGIIA